jgi:uncharacterized protein YceH (UPF0502 family)
MIDRRRGVLSVKLSEVEILHPVEVRVLGALLEKDMATPEYYPLTLNSLQAACNQKSSREPVVNYDEDIIAQALELLLLSRSPCPSRVRSRSPASIRRG